MTTTSAAVKREEYIGTWLLSSFIRNVQMSLFKNTRDLPGGPLVKNSRVGNAGLILGEGTKITRALFHS